MCTKRLSYEQVRSLFIKALEAGARRESATRVEWDISGQCQSPKFIELHARPGSESITLPPASFGTTEDGEQLFSPLARPRTYQSKRIVVGVGNASNPLTVALIARCRTCETCLAQRSTDWRFRAMSETRMAARTWFGTLTLRPDEMFKMRAAASLRLRKSAVELEALSPDDVFYELNRQMSPEITKFVKRIRKQSGAKLRIMLVSEAHKSGLPHFHMLIHEVKADEMVKHACLTAAWRLGFSKFKLVEDLRQAVYLCKYISKTKATRVRASLEYGCGVIADAEANVLGHSGCNETWPPRALSTPPPDLPFTYKANQFTTYGAPERGTDPHVVSCVISAEPDEQARAVLVPSRMGGPGARLSGGTEGSAATAPLRERGLSTVPESSSAEASFRRSVLERWPALAGSDPVPT